MSISGSSSGSNCVIEGMRMAYYDEMLIIIIIIIISLYLGMLADAVFVSVSESSSINCVIRYMRVTC